jgi:hypothetical protein
MLIDIDQTRFHIFHLSPFPASRSGRTRTLDQVMIRQVFYQCTTAATYVKFFTKLAQVLFWTAADGSNMATDTCSGANAKNFFLSVINEFSI